jgi:hypothetical protein
MTTSNAKTTTRMVVASFVAGAGAMVLVGLVGPVMMQSGPLIREAFAAEVSQSSPVIEPLDVQAIEAQLADADRMMVAMRATTDDDIARLQRLTPRR